MNRVVLQCPKCSHVDERQEWRSLDEAASAGALSSGWSCPSCAWPDPELVETEQPVTVPDESRP